MAATIQRGREARAADQELYGDADEEEGLLVEMVQRGREKEEKEQEEPKTRRDRLGTLIGTRRGGQPTGERKKRKKRRSKRADPAASPLRNADRRTPPAHYRRARFQL